MVVLYIKSDIKTILNIPNNLEVISILALGYSDEKTPSSDRYSQERLPLNKTTFFK